METILYVEEVDGQPCLLLDTDIIKHTYFQIGQAVKVKTSKNRIEVEKMLDE